jgi:hypothetical protein
MEQSNDVNEHILRITGSASLPEKLDYKNYLIGVDADVTDIQKKRREDGTYDFIYKARLLTAEIVKDNGEAMKSKDKTRISQKLRARSWVAHQEHNIQIDPEEFYEKVGKGIILYYDEILRMLGFIK